AGWAVTAGVTPSRTSSTKGATQRRNENDMRTPSSAVAQGRCTVSGQRLTFYDLPVRTPGSPRRGLPGGSRCIACVCRCAMQSIPPRTGAGVGTRRESAWCFPECDLQYLITHHEACAPSPWELPPCCLLKRRPKTASTNG